MEWSPLGEPEWALDPKPGRPLPIAEDRAVVAASRAYCAIVPRAAAPTAAVAWRDEAGGAWRHGDVPVAAKGEVLCGTVLFAPGSRGAGAMPPSIPAALAVGDSCGNLVVSAALPPAAGASASPSLRQRMLDGPLTSLALDTAPRGSPDGAGSLWCLHESGDAAVTPAGPLLARAAGSSAHLRFRRWALGDHLHGDGDDPWTNIAVAEPEEPLPGVARLRRWRSAGSAASSVAGAAAPPLLVASGGHGCVTQCLLADESRSSTSLHDAAAAMVRDARSGAMALVGAVPGLGGALRWFGATPAPPASSEDEEEAAADAATERYRTHPALRVAPAARWQDAPRRAVAGQLVVSPGGRLAAVADSLGRVAVLRCSDQVVCRLWKGYRAAQVAWLRSPDGELRLAVYTPKRRCLELWPPLCGSRVAAVRVPAGFCIRLVPCSGPDGGCWLMSQADGEEEGDGRIECRAVRCLA
ncbi:hypothetical protein FNF29_06801 [Cafeteria roenbergensis]|uniref:Rab3-GAP regulatory subunit N-terminal domain-containing protein n=1 Tax=Cafeteria roenbergensis TaxID=33653 RepID=A0A5A8C607_CAFRO|nr:hypothetical protein FNF29_06801 [Cafeteria roenbergensis]|eukprot:KAA0148265.1 hypothetical protein FNF29_06801 [Cafeteria roenbergensis]